VIGLLLLGSLLSPPPGPPEGRVSLRGLYSADDGDATPTVGMLYLDTILRAQGLWGGATSLEVDAGFVLDATDAEERRFGRTDSLDQVRQLFVGHDGVLGSVDVRLGRRLVMDAGNGWVDGVDATVAISKSAALGVYGGLSPDPVDYALRTDAQATGVYGTWKSDALRSSAAYNAVLRGGDLDRQFVFQRNHWRVTRQLFLASYLVADFARGGDVTTLLGSADYSPTRAVNLGLNVSRYSVERYRDQRVYRNVVEPNQALVLGDEVAELVYDRVRGSAGVRLFDGLYHYHALEWKRRSQDARNAWLYTLGARHDDVLGSGLRADARVTLSNHFASDSVLAGVDLARDVGATWTVTGRLTWYDGRTVGRDTERGRTFDEAQEILLAGGSFTWRPSQHHQLDMDYDLVREAELQDVRNEGRIWVHTLMGRYTWRL
jgi:hypothetical protein